MHVCTSTFITHTHIYKQGYNKDENMKFKAHLQNFWKLVINDDGIKWGTKYTILLSSGGDSILVPSSLCPGQEIGLTERLP